MKCLRCYEWVKLPRKLLPEGKGLMGDWARLAAHVAFRKGFGTYCGFKNPVEPGMWSGGIVGLESILKAKNRTYALQKADKLQELGYIEYELEKKTKKLTYKVNDFVIKCSGEECKAGND